MNSCTAYKLSRAVRRTTRTNNHPTLLSRPDASSCAFRDASLRITCTLSFPWMSLPRARVFSLHCFSLAGFVPPALCGTFHEFPENATPVSRKRGNPQHAAVARGRLGAREREREASLGRPILCTTTTQRGWCREVFVSIPVQSQSQKSLPGGGGV